jgi:uncharacterized membrane protein
MKTENSILMRQAREALDGRWGFATGSYLLYILISGCIPPLSLIISGPMTQGMAGFSLKFWRRQQPDIPDLFTGFNNFWNALLAYLLIIVFVVLWSLLLIIPGIIAAISYSQTFYILSENPSIDPGEAIDRSKAMMNGYKAKYFRLCLRFFGWALLCCLTLGIGFFFLIPWVQVTFAGFYDDLKKNEISYN